MVGMTGLQGVLENRDVQKIKSLDRKTSSSAKSLSFSEELDRAMGKGAQKDKKLWNTCVEMESLFVNQMFKEMRHTIHKTGWLHGGHAEEIFEDMLYNEYSLKVSKNSKLGLAKMIYDQMSPKV